MALSSLTSLTQEQYNALSKTNFPSQPSRTSTGSPDNRISVQLGFWVGTDVLAFTMTDQPATSAGLGISDANSNILGVNVNRGSSPNAVTSYWTVNMGSGASGTNWQITFNVADSGTSTGTWVFTKGKSSEPAKGEY